MSRLDRVRQWARENRDPSILEALHRTNLWSVFVVLLGPALAVLAFWAVRDISTEILPSDGKWMLAIFVLAAVYWITGAIPPFATGILIIGLEVTLVGMPALAPGHDPSSDIHGWKEFTSISASPIILLMLGGFVLSQAAHKHGLDRVMAVTFLKPFGTRPKIILLGIMLVTANFSMWMSNTATAAMMVTLILPIISQIDERSPLRKAFLLAVPIAANIGGIGTPIGTPPNAIAFQQLYDHGVGITFIEWMLFAVPFAVVMLLVAWIMLLIIFPADTDRLELNLSQRRGKPGLKQWVVYITFTITVGLWATSKWTGIPIYPVALLPIVVFTVTRLIDRYDINQLDWDILLLMAGGLALGHGMQSSGLAAWLVDLLPLSSLSLTVALMVFAAATLILSTFMSNTAVANLLTPIGLGLAATVAGALDTDADSILQKTGVAIALGASLAMSLPVSTPPNAIAFASGQVQVKDFVRTGVIIGIVGIAAVTLLCRVFIS
jgi:sodium-dependent dicarboxylate transporter 2/3/5